MSKLAIAAAIALIASTAHAEGVSNVYCSYPLNAIEFKIIVSTDEMKINLYMNGDKLRAYRFVEATGTSQPSSVYMQVKDDQKPTETELFYLNARPVFENMLFGPCDADFKPTKVNWLR